MKTTLTLRLICSLFLSVCLFTVQAFLCYLYKKFKKHKIKLNIACTALQSFIVSYSSYIPHIPQMAHVLTLTNLFFQYPLIYLFFAIKPLAVSRFEFGRLLLVLRCCSSITSLKRASAVYVCFGCIFLYVLDIVRCVRTVRTAF